MHQKMEILVSYIHRQVKINITKQVMYNLLTTMYQWQGIVINHRMEIMVSYTPRQSQNIITKQVSCNLLILLYQIQRLLNIK